MAQMRFEEISLKGSKYVVVDGKKRKRTRRFYQTRNPFNTNAQHVPKSREEILVELEAERDAWIASDAP